MITTILLAIGLLILAVIFLSIGKLLTGKSRLKKGCGMTFGKKKDKCDLCGKKSCDDEEK